MVPIGPAIRPDSHAPRRRRTHGTARSFRYSAHMPHFARARALLTLAHLGPPRELVALVRWAALVVVVLAAGRVAGSVVLFSNTSLGGKVLTALALTWLCWRWLRGYRSGGFGLAGSLSEGAALLVLGLALEDPLGVLGVLYIALAFRALYGSVRQALITALVYLAAHLCAVALAAGPESVVRPEVLQQAPGVLLVAGLMQFLAVTLTRNGRAAVCERTLAVARGAPAVP